MHVYIPLNIYYFPQQKSKRTDAWFHVSRYFKPFNETFWNLVFVPHIKMKRFMNIYL